MKLFGSFNAVKFLQENLLFITNGNYIYYVYNVKHDYWSKYRRAGNDSITIENYEDVSKEELLAATKGKEISCESDIMRLIESKGSLNGRDLFVLLRADYPLVMTGDADSIVSSIIWDANVTVHAYYTIKEYFDSLDPENFDVKKVVNKLLKIYKFETGIDYFSERIRILSGHDPGGYYWIQPVRILDYTNTHDLRNVAELDGVEISIDEDSVLQFLLPILERHFDQNLRANSCRMAYDWDRDDGSERSIEGFETILTHNFYTFDSVREMIAEMKLIIDAFKNNEGHPYIAELRKMRKLSATMLMSYSSGKSKEEVDEYNANRPKEDNTDPNIIMDFFERLAYRLEYMMRVGEEEGFDLISFMGP